MTFLSNPLPKFGQAVPWASSKQWPHSQSTAYSNSTHWTKDMLRHRKIKRIRISKKMWSENAKRKRWNKLSSNYIWTTSGTVCLYLFHTFCLLKRRWNKLSSTKITANTLNIQRLWEYMFVDIIQCQDVCTSKPWWKSKTPNIEFLTQKIKTKSSAFRTFPFEAPLSGAASWIFSKSLQLDC